MSDTDPYKKELKTKADGTYSTKLIKKRNYDVTVSKEGYETATFRIRVEGLMPVIETYLEKILVPYSIKFVCDIANVTMYPTLRVINKATGKAVADVGYQYSTVTRYVDPEKGYVVAEYVSASTTGLQNSFRVYDTYHYDYKFYASFPSRWDDGTNVPGLYVYTDIWEPNASSATYTIRPRNIKKKTGYWWHIFDIINDTIVEVQKVELTQPYVFRMDLSYAIARNFTNYLVIQDRVSYVVYHVHAGRPTFLDPDTGELVAEYVDGDFNMYEDEKYTYKFYSVPPASWDERGYEIELSVAQQIRVYGLNGQGGTKVYHIFSGYQCAPGYWWHAANFNDGICWEINTREQYSQLPT